MSKLELTTLFNFISGKDEYIPLCPQPVGPTDPTGSTVPGASDFLVVPVARPARAWVGG